MWSGPDPGLILGCCKISQKKIDHRNDVIMQKNYRLNKKQEGTVLIRGTDLKIQFDSSKKDHPVWRRRGGVKAPFLKLSKC